MIAIILQTVRAAAKIAKVASTTVMFPRYSKGMATIQRLAKAIPMFPQPQKEITMILCIAKGDLNRKAIVEYVVASCVKRSPSNNAMSGT